MLDLAISIPLVMTDLYSLATLLTQLRNEFFPPAIAGDVSSTAEATPDVCLTPAPATLSPSPQPLPEFSAAPMHDRSEQKCSGLAQPNLPTIAQLISHQSTAALSHWGIRNMPVPVPNLVEPVASATARPASGSQLFAQRRAALRAGQTYTRLPANSFQEVWQSATMQPTYEQWIQLLHQEAEAIANGQGSNRLTVLLGDSISLWFPNDQLPSDRFWLNQGISGDTSAGVLRRLNLFDQTRPDVIHLMVGINDLRRGATDAELLSNIQQIMQQLRSRHPDAQIFIHSLLPTRLPAIPSDRIAGINQQIANLAVQESVSYLALQPHFSDPNGNLRRELTTDGIHLSREGYALWHSALRWFDLA